MDGTNKIIKVKKNEDGEITDVMIEDGSVIPINHAILMAKRGIMEDAVVARGKNGGEFLQIHPDSLTDHSLASLPTFKD